MYRNWNQTLVLAIVALCSLAIVADAQAFHRRRGCGGSGGYYGGYTYSGYGYGNGYAAGGTPVYGPGATPQAATGINANANVRSNVRTDGTLTPSPSDRSVPSGSNNRGPTPENQREDAVPPPPSTTSLIP
jgi:hypothetical protein